VTGAGGRPANQTRIRIPKVAELVAAELRRRIIVREYEAGELLPSEGVLTGEFDVARTTMRDAFRVLESEGLLEVRRGAGGGARVRAPGVGMISSYAALLLQFGGATLADVHLGRTLIEAPAAALLAERPDRPRITGALRAALADEDGARQPEALALAEGRFHLLVVELTGNRALMMLSAVANRLIADQVARSLTTDGPAIRAGFARAHQAHRRLVDLIEAGDGPGAEELWRRHLESGRKRLASAPGAPRTAIDLLPGAPVP
jgi:DNA-binding FadR family transcriptional regulator